MIPITMIDTTGIYTADEVADTVQDPGVVLAACGRKREWNLGLNPGNVLFKSARFRFTRH
jgi:hypothetical protein